MTKECRPTRARHPMTASQVAAALSEIGTLLELQGENPFRAQAYHAAARTIETLDGDLAAMVAAGKLDHVRGIGATMREAVTALVSDGHYSVLDDLRAKTPAGLIQMLRVPGLGPKKVKVLHENDVSNLEALQKACETGRVAKLKGFGAKTQDKILEGLKFLAAVGSRIRIDQASDLADGIVTVLRKVPGVIRIEACGSLRRRKETIGDIDVLCTSKDPASVMKAFTALPAVTQVLNQGDTLCSVMLGVGRHGAQVRGDLRVVADEQFAYAVHHFTGSMEHNVHLRHEVEGEGLQDQRIRPDRPDRTHRVQDRDRVLCGPRPGLHPAGIA